MIYDEAGATRCSGIDFGGLPTQSCLGRAPAPPRSNANSFNRKDLCRRAIHRPYVTVTKRGGYRGISERAVCTVAWVAKEAGVVQLVRAAREGPGRSRRCQNVPDRPTFESRPASGHVCAGPGNVIRVGRI